MITDTGTINKILICDDDEDDCILFKDALQEVNSNVAIISLSDSENLLQMLHGNEIPDLLMLDLNMPTKNGKECLTEIRQNKQFDQLPIIIYSTAAIKSDIDETFSKGANLFFQKTDDFMKLKQAIRKILQTGKHSLLQPNKEHFILYVT